MDWELAALSLEEPATYCFGCVFFFFFLEKNSSFFWGVRSVSEKRCFLFFPLYSLYFSLFLSYLDGEDVGLARRVLVGVTQALCLVFRRVFLFCFWQTTELVRRSEGEKERERKKSKEACRAA